MEICNLERGKGKTTYLVHRSHVTQYPVVCADYTGVGVVKDIAKRIGGIYSWANDSARIISKWIITHK